MPPASASIFKLAADYMQLRQDCQGASASDPNGPYTKLLAQLDQAFKPWLNEAFNDSQTTSDQQASMNASDVPTPYSTDDIPSEVQNSPMSQFPPDDVGRMQNFATNSAMMAAPFRTTGNDTVGVTHHAVGVSDQRGVNGGVRDHRTVQWNANTGDPNIVVRDHRHPVDPLPPTALPPAAPPPAAAPPSSNGGTNFTSGADLDSVDQLNSNFQAAKQNALANPNDPKAQIAFQDAAQALQLMVNMLLQMSQMLASMADKAIQNAKVNAA
jgi:hypothetical protein